MGGVEVLSSEGTTQGDPLAMPVYAIGITPLLEAIKPGTMNMSRVRHVAFADDLGGAGELMHLRNWNNVVTFGPLLGYHPNASKSWLVVKPIEEEKARQIIEGTNIKVTTEGKSYLGGYIGSESGNANYAKD